MNYKTTCIGWVNDLSSPGKDSNISVSFKADRFHLVMNECEKGRQCEVEGLISRTSFTTFQNY